MRNSKAKRLRKLVGYNPNTHRTTEEDYNIVDKSEQLGMMQAGVNPDGTPKFVPIIVNKCLVSLKPESLRKFYQNAKECMK